MAKRMLIVVDETVTARWFPGHFEADGWDVIRAGDEASALASLEIHALIGDLHLNALMSRPSIYAAATKVIMDAMSIAFMTCIAFGTATATLVSQSLGAKRPDLAERFGWESVRVGCYVMGAFGLFTVLSPDLVLAVFSKDAAVIAFEREYLRAALARNGANLSKTSRDVGLTRHHLRKLLRRHRLIASPKAGSQEG